jgi:hypothetical protein
MLSGGKNRNPVVLATHSDGALDAVVVWLELFIGERPVVFDPIHGMLPEVGRRVAQHHGVPMQRAPAQHANAIHGDGVGIGVPDGVGDVSGIEQCLLLRAEATKLHVVRPTMRSELMRRDFGSRFEQENLGTRFAKFLGDDSPGGAGADHARVVDCCRQCLATSSLTA